MEFFRTKINNIRQKLSEKGFTDPQLIGLLLLAAVGLSVVWNGTKVVQQNYELVQKVAVLEEENRILELENRNREIQIEYYKTPEFAELKARKVNGKASPGETVYIVTSEVALAGLKTTETDDRVSQSDKPNYQKNFESWISFFFGG